MTSFMMPHVYGRLMPEHLNATGDNFQQQYIINRTLSNYLSISTKAIEQYAEIWDTMSKLTNMYENIGDKPRNHYEIQEMKSVFKLDEGDTIFSMTPRQAIVKTTLEHIYNCKKGDNCVIPIGDIFAQVDVDCLYILSLCFNEVYIYKPNATPAILSDKFVVCKDFKMINTEYLKPAICHILRNEMSCSSLYIRRINNNYMNTLIEANSVIGQQQLEAINNTITLIEQGKKKEKIEALKKQQAARCADWNKRFGVTFHGYKDELEA
jgi:hypothetical protein